MKGVIPIVGALAVVAVVLILFITGGSLPQGSITDVFCNDYEFICCGLSKTSTASDSSYCALFNCDDPWICVSDQCKITNINPSGSGFRIYHATGETTTYIYGTSVPLTVYRGDKVQSISTTLVFTYENWNQALKWCGDASCGSGITGIIGSTVFGADGCSYVTDQNLYSSNGVLLKKPEGNQVSYTVPIDECYLAVKGRHICGNTEESCDTNNDCVAGHTLVYQGYGAECHTGLVEWYGCRVYGSEPSDFDILPWESDSGYNYGSRCEVIGSKRVQCCPGAGSCGSNAVCDPQTFTCSQVQTVECMSDWECGTNQWYDQPTKQIRQPKCTGGVCTYKVIDTVDCYYNTECPEGWYCDNDFKCKQSFAPKSNCPLMCCVDDSRYFDKPCPDDRPVCCPDQQGCAKTLQECFDQGHGKQSVNWLMVILGAVVMVIITIAVTYLVPQLRPLGLMFLNPFVILLLLIAYIILFAGVALSIAGMIV